MNDEHTHAEQSSIEIVARIRDHEIRRSEEGIFIKPGRVDGDGEMHLSVDALGAALRAVGYNRADLFPDG